MRQSTLPKIDIAGRKVGDGESVFMIAEIGFNNAGSVALGVEMIQAAAAAGADAAKFQSYRTDELCLTTSEHFQLLRQSEMDADVHRELAAAARDAGILFFSTPFDAKSVELLAELDVPAWKIASMDLNNVVLLEQVGSTGKPILLSTGMGTLGEIREALEVLDRVGASQRTVLMHCISHYPTDIFDVNLRTINQIREETGLPTGFSDHSLGNTAALASVSLGAVAIEKHFTTDRTLDGPDHAISADGEQFKELVSGVRMVEAALGRPTADDSRPDRASAGAARRGLYARRSLAAGTILSLEDIKMTRPPNEMLPADLPKIVGRRLTRALAMEEAVTPDALARDDKS